MMMTLMMTYEHEYVNTETENNIKSTKSHSYDIDKQCSKLILNATNVGSTSIPNTRFKKQQQFFFKQYNHRILFQNSPTN